MVVEQGEPMEGGFPFLGLAQGQIEQEQEPAGQHERMFAGKPAGFGPEQQDKEQSGPEREEDGQQELHGLPLLIPAIGLGKRPDESFALGPEIEGFVHGQQEQEERAQQPPPAVRVRPCALPAPAGGGGEIAEHEQGAQQRRMFRVRQVHLQRSDWVMTTIRRQPVARRGQNLI